MLRDPRTPVVALRLSQSDTHVDFIAAPGLAPDWVAVVIRKRGAPLRSCAALAAEVENGSVTTPLEAFDRAGYEVRYELPLSGLLRVAVAERLVLNACETRWPVGGVQLSELRRFALLTLFRRAQVDETLPIPPVLDEAQGRPAWLSGATETTSGRVIQARLPLIGGDQLTLTYAPESADAMVLSFSLPRGNRDPAECDVALEVGPALVGARMHSAADDRTAMEWRVHDMSGYLALGVVDRASLRYCGRDFGLQTFLGGIRRHVLLTLLARAEHRGRTTPRIDLPAAPPSTEQPPALPRARPPGSPGDVFAPDDPSPTDRAL